MSRHEGIVLCAIKYKESSKILTLFTKDLGKIKVMAQGVLKPKSSELAISEVFSLSEFELKKGRSFYYINSSELLNSHYDLRQDFEKMVLGFHFIEIVDKLTLEEETNEKLYLLLKIALKELCISNNIAPILISFSIKAAAFAGYRPYLSSCVNCGNTKSTIWSFDNEQGGIICEHCKSREGLEISNREVFLLNELMMTKITELEKMKISKDEINRLEEIVSKHILYNIDIKEFKSSSMVRECSLDKYY